MCDHLWDHEVRLKNAQQFQSRPIQVTLMMQCVYVAYTINRRLTLNVFSVYDPPTLQTSNCPRLQVVILPAVGTFSVVAFLKYGGRKPSYQYKVA